MKEPDAHVDYKAAFGASENIVKVLRQKARRYERALDELVQACTAVVDAEEFAIALAQARGALREGETA